MKKILSAILCFCFVLSSAVMFFGCGASNRPTAFLEGRTFICDDGTGAEPSKITFKNSKSGEIILGKLMPGYSTKTDFTYTLSENIIQLEFNFLGFAFTMELFAEDENTLITREMSGTIFGLTQSEDVDGLVFLATDNIIQDENPDAPVFSYAFVSDGTTFYNDFTPMKLVVGDHNYQNGYTLSVATKNDVEDVNWTVYTDNPSVATAYRKDGKVYIRATGTGTAKLYISHIYAKNFEDLDPAAANYVCDINVSSPYNALVIADPTYVTGEKDGITYYGLNNRTNESNAMKKLFESMSFDNGTSINGFDKIYTPEKKSYDGTDTVDYIRTTCEELAQKTSEHSVTYIYILCHGEEKTGTLGFGLASDDPSRTSYPVDTITLNELKDMLDPIKGKIVLLLGSCYSGEAIDEVDNSVWNIFKNKFISIPDTSGVFREENKYYVLTASTDNEMAQSLPAWEIDEEKQTLTFFEEDSYDAFTSALTNALGWDYLESSTPQSTTYSMTLNEVYTKMIQYITKLSDENRVAWELEDGKLLTTPQVFPENSDFILFEKVK